MIQGIRCGMLRRGLGEDGDYGLSKTWKAGLGGAEAGEACKGPACRAARRHGHADMKKMKEPWEVLDATRFISAAG